MRVLAKSHAGAALRDRAFFARGLLPEYSGDGVWVTYPD